MEEHALIGSKEIAEYLRWPQSTLLTRSKELQQAGAITKNIFGKGKQRKRRLYAFPSILQRYIITKGNT